MWISSLFERSSRIATRHLLRGVLYGALLAGSVSAAVTPVAAQPVPEPAVPETAAPETVDERLTSETAPQPGAPEVPEVTEQDDDRSELTQRERDRRKERRLGKRRRTDQQVSIGSSVHIREDEVARDVVTIGGSLKVDGEVMGDAVAVGGSARVQGSVTGDLVAVGGDVWLGEHAEVLGDVASVGGKIHREAGARVSGEISEVGFGKLFSLGDFDGIDLDFSHDELPRRAGRLMSHLWSIFTWMLVALVACLFVLLAERPFTRVAAKVAEAPFASLLVGVASFVLLIPVLLILVLVLTVSIIGIPLLLLIPFVLLALFLLSFMGYTAVGYRLAEWADGRFGWNLGSPYLRVVIGLGLLSAVSFTAAIFDLFGGPFGFLAILVGFVGGALELTAWLMGFGAAILSQAGFDRGSSHLMPPPPPPSSEWSSPSEVTPQQAKWVDEDAAAGKPEDDQEHQP